MKNPKYKWPATVVTKPEEIEAVKRSETDACHFMDPPGKIIDGVCYAHPVPLQNWRDYKAATQA